MVPGQTWPTTRVTLVAKIQNPQDRPAWQHFVDLYGPVILRYCRRRGLQDADAQNVLQEVLSRVSRSIRTFEYDPHRGRFRGWLGLITDQQIQRYVNKEKRIGQGIGAGAGDDLCGEVSGEVDPEWVEEFNASVYRLAIDRIRSEFDDATWEVFTQVWEASQSPKDVAARLRREPSWVYQAKFKVMQRLKEEIVLLSNDAAIFCRG
jgi:RNA polymerase sigma-70 factor (ECF subfamily)